MKTASEIRDMMKSDEDKLIENPCRILESGIIREAQKHNTSASIEVDCSVCPIKVADRVVEELKRNGYKASWKHVFDIRDGDYIIFEVEWV